MTHWTWPVTVLPNIRVAGQFPHHDRDFQVSYRSATHSLHLYGYGGVIQLGELEQPFSPGDMTITPTGTTSRYHLPVGGTHWCIHFDAAPTPPDDGPRLRLPLYLPRGPAGAYVRQVMTRITHLFALTSRELAPPAASAALLQLLLELAIRPDHSPRPGAAEAAVMRLAHLIDARWAEQWTVPKLADVVNRSQNHLAAQFRRIMGMTIPRYLLTRRMEMARMLLAGSELPIAQVAKKCGLPDAQHFNKQFRRLVGTSPSQYRAEARLNAGPAPH